MDLYVENKYSEYYCFGCALVALQYRSEISEPPNTEFGKFVRIVPFPGPSHDFSAVYRMECRVKQHSHPVDFSDHVSQQNQYQLNLFLCEAQFTRTIFP